MPASTTSAHGLTREQVQAILVEPLMAASVFLAAGPRILDVTAAGPVRIPTLVGMIAPCWVGENVLIPEVAADFGEVRLLDGILSLKSLTRFSNELARSSIIALDSALRDRMVLHVAAKLDTALIAGTGDPVEGKRTTPLGIVNYPGVQEILAAGAPSLDVRPGRRASRVRCERRASAWRWRSSRCTCGGSGAGRPTRNACGCGRWRRVTQP